jgi:DNA-binding NtrC family response regulator
VRPVGSTSRRRVDLRVVAATHRDLPAEAKAGRFREDLLYRLAGAVIRIPPLRERGGDVVVLAKAFLARLNRERRTDKRFSRGALEAFSRHAWPGNVRELQHAVSRLYLLAAGAEIPADPGLFASASADAARSASPDDVRPLAELEMDAIDHALRVTGGDKTKAARLLGISRTSLYEKLKRRSGEPARDDSES